MFELAKSMNEELADVYGQPVSQIFWGLGPPYKLEIVPVPLIKLMMSRLA